MKKGIVFDSHCDSNTAAILGNHGIKYPVTGILRLSAGSMLIKPPTSLSGACLCECLSQPLRRGQYLVVLST
jgi:hypothetical protein